MRKTLIQNTIPIFIELERLLESKKSPLTGSLMDCLRLLLKDYTNEIDEISVAHKQLQRELLYDSINMNLQRRCSEATARSVLKDVNKGTSTPALSSLKVPKVKSCNGPTGSGGAPSNRPREVMESLRRQPFSSDDEG
ncbi:hypothetical protein EUGRSUZ_D00108 [Eucalyptus grandis]|uniref:Uncharacterized protein n=2 Tax=Eucalyptus grandis TaxID=71139 RepID=A0ACC3L1K3_EUCGR|nr:hypothetical protein EUGRSUZ_D00108 [Eucalyptus grandis]